MFGIAYDWLPEKFKDCSLFVNASAFFFNLKMKMRKRSAGKEISNG